MKIKILLNLRHPNSTQSRNEVGKSDAETWSLWMPDNYKNIGL